MMRTLQNNCTRKFLLRAPFCLIGFLLLPVSPLTAQDSLPVIELSPSPAPQDLSAAKQALQNGQIVMMQGGDVVDFDGLLAVDLESRLQPGIEPFDVTSTGVLQLMAARLASNGSLHSYECYTPPGYQDAGDNAGLNCSAAFQGWVDQEEEDAAGTTAFPEPLAADWTDLGHPDKDYFDNNGNKLGDYVRLYRLNDNNLQNDWYLLIRDPLSVPNYWKTCGFIVTTCGFFTEKRDFQISINAYVSNSGFSVFDWSPRNGIYLSSAQLSIGGSLGNVAPAPGVGYTIGWNQSSSSTKVLTNISQKEVSWVEDLSPPSASPDTPDNSKPFTSHQAMIFQVPEGTASFEARLYSFFESHWYDVIPGRSYNVSVPGVRRVVTLAPPVFNVTPTSVVLLPQGTATFSLQASIPTSGQGLKWTVTRVPAGYSVAPQSGTGTSAITVKATTAPPGDIDYIQRQTSPPFAAPSVAKLPLEVQVNVAGTPAALPPHGVLLAGGVDWTGATLSSTEVWNPATSASTKTLPMNATRQQHTATALLDGTILIAGGYDAVGNPQSSAEIFNPSTGSFTLTTGSMTAPRAAHTATLLTSGPLAGQVLIAGGCCTSNNKALNTAELYNPSTQAFRATGTLPVATMGQSATLLPDGTVLLAGGTDARGSLTSLAETDLYYPLAGVFQLSGRLNNARQGHSATLLNSGQILVAGGWRIGDDPTSTTELYNPPSRTFTFTGSMGARRRYQAATLLADGTVLEAAGLNGANSAETYNPNAGTFSFTSNNLSEYRDHPTATFIVNTETSADLQVLIAGGVPANNGSSTGGKGLDLYNPASRSFAAAGQMVTPRTGLTATLF